MSGSLTTDPRPTYLYRIYDTSGSLLYVGITLNLNNRMNQHRKHWKNREWYKTADAVRVELYADRSTASLAEHRAILREDPAHNWAKEEQYKDNKQPDPTPLKVSEFNAGRWRTTYGS